MVEDNLYTQFYRYFSPADGKQIGVEAEHPRGDVPSILDGIDGFGALFGAEITDEVSDIDSIQNCSRKVLAGRVPSFMEFSGAQADESLRVHDITRPEKDTSLLGRLLGLIPIFDTTIEKEPSDELVMRKGVFTAIRALYNNGEESLYGDYCTLVRNAETVCDRLGLDTVTFPSYNEFVRMGTERRAQELAAHADAVRVVNDYLEDYLDNASYLEEQFTGHAANRGELQQEFAKMFTETNGEALIERETSLVTARANYIRTRHEHAAIFKGEYTPPEQETQGRSATEIDAATVDFQKRIQLAKRLSVEMLNDGSYSGRAEYREKFGTFANADIAALEAALAGYGKDSATLADAVAKR